MSDLSSAPSPDPEEGAVPRLEKAIVNGQGIADRPDIAPGMVRLWVSRMRTRLRQIYGPDSEAVRLWPTVRGELTRDEARTLIADRLARSRELLHLLEAAPSKALSSDRRHRVFIGHGRSPLWRELKDFLAERLNLTCEEFNRESVPGIATTERLSEMLAVSTFAFLVMTGEDEHADSTRHARANVIHEVGLFQGRLGPRRAIILLEEGCQQFSNIHGLSHISFPCNRVSAAFEEIRRVLEREHVARA